MGERERERTKKNIQNLNSGTGRYPMLQNVYFVNTKTAIDAWLNPNRNSSLKLRYACF